MATKPIPPDDVNSPKRRWTLVKVLYDGGPGPNSFAIAIGRWDNKPRLAMRWNGDKKNPIGNPQSRGLPTWFLVPDAYRDAILDTLSKDMIVFAQKFFE